MNFLLSRPIAPDDPFEGSAEPMRGLSTALGETDGSLQKRLQPYDLDTIKGVVLGIVLGCAIWFLCVWMTTLFL
jgi:hypothetical protein